jgi:hypothetical protein
MYHDIAYRNDELKRDLERASSAAATGWRFRELRSSKPRLPTAAVGFLGSILVSAGEWLTARGRPTLTSST